MGRVVIQKLKKWRYRLTGISTGRIEEYTDSQILFAIDGYLSFVVIDITAMIDQLPVIKVDHPPAQSIVGVHNTFPTIIGSPFMAGRGLWCENEVQTILIDDFRVIPQQ